KYISRQPAGPGRQGAGLRTGPRGASAGQVERDMERIAVHNFPDRTSLITINPSERRNAICSQTAIDLQQAFQAFDASEQRVAVLTGAGDQAFSAGADVADVPELWRCVPTVGVTTEKPIIVAVSGWCVGGGLTLAT